MTAEPAQSWIRPHYASFDGLRGLATGLIFLRHFVYPITHWSFLAYAWVGVDMFFVLSGFLITGILCDTAEKPHALRDFYARRALRIYPLYWGLFTCIFVAAWGFGAVTISPYMWAWPLYVCDLMRPFLDFVRHNPDAVHFRWHAHTYQFSMGYCWSLCVEEQFYLIWPLVVLRVRSRKRLLRIVVAGMAIALATRLLLSLWWAPSTHVDLYYMSPYTHCGALLAGSGCAVWLRETRLRRRELHAVALSSLVSATALLLTGLKVTGALADDGLSAFVGTYGFTLLAIAGAGVLLYSLDEGSWLSRLLRLRPLAALGTVSYGFYLLHDLLSQPMLAVFARQRTPLRQQMIVVMAWFFVCWALSWVVYRLYERPFLRLKRVLAPRAGEGGATVPRAQQRAV